MQQGREGQFVRWLGAVEHPERLEGRVRLGICEEGTELGGTGMVVLFREEADCGLPLPWIGVAEEADEFR